MKNKQILISALILIIIVVVAIVAYGQKGKSENVLTTDTDIVNATSTDPAKLVYTNSASRFSLEYPKEALFSVKKVKKDGDTLDVITLKLNDVEFMLVPNLKSAKDVEDEIVAYTGILFENPKQLQNSKVVIGNFTGFKSVLSSTSLRYTLYNKRDDGRYLILRDEITLPTAVAREKAEGVFEEILKSVKVY
ncbi:MAG: hypothetical protein V4481_01260 [Patescibacteria group bacterium]